MPTLRQLEYLVALADARHFGRAAAAVYASQPTLSQQIRTLEARLGVVLVERGDNPVQLTPIGREIAERARLILQGVDDLQALAQRSVNALAGTIRLGVSPTLGPYLMPAVVATLHKTYPDMRLYIREGIPEDLTADLRRGGLDMVLASLPVGGPDLVIEPLFHEPLHMVAAPDNPLFRKRMIRRADLEGAQVLSLDPRHPFHQQTRSICQDLKATVMREYEGTSLDTLRQMAGSNIGLALLPELYLRSEVGGEDMVRRLQIEDWQASRTIAAIWRHGSAYAQSYGLISRAIAEKAHATLAMAIDKTN